MFDRELGGKRSWEWEGSVHLILLLQKNNGRVACLALVLHSQAHLDLNRYLFFLLACLGWAHKHAWKKLSSKFTLECCTQVECMQLLGCEYICSLYRTAEMTVWPNFVYPMRNLSVSDRKYDICCHSNMSSMHPLYLKWPLKLHDLLQVLKWSSQWANVV